MPFPFDEYEEDDERMRRGAPMGYAQAANTAGSVAARPGYNPQQDANSAAYVKHERTPGDGKGPTPYSGMANPQGRSPMMPQRQMAQQPAAQASPVAQTAAAKPAGAAAGAASGSGGPMNPLVIAAALQYLDKRRDRGEMAKEGRQGIAQQYAASTGYPMYGVGAAKVRNAMNDENGEDYITEILKMREQRRGR
jgi:hypothetical protein